MTLKMRCTQKDYQIDVDLVAIMDADRYYENENEWDKVLSQRLDTLCGVCNTDYNGHFGHFVFVRIEAEYDSKATWDNIEEEMNEHREGYENRRVRSGT